MWLASQSDVMEIFQHMAGCRQTSRLFVDPQLLFGRLMDISGLLSDDKNTNIAFTSLI